MGKASSLTPVVSRVRSGERTAFHDAIVELRRLGISRIDMIIVSHPDPDHTGALEAILRSFEVGKLLVDHYASNDSRLERTIRAWCLEKIACQLSLPEYLVWHSGETRFEIFGLGSIHGPYLSDNERSLTLRVSEGHQSALLTGDLPRWAELSLLRRIETPVGLLKLGHHGSRTSSDRQFLGESCASIGLVEPRSTQSVWAPTRRCSSAAGGVEYSSG